jgi:uncharacterized membrane protein YphA (DoxX/SURF4 family)
MDRTMGDTVATADRRYTPATGPWKAWQAAMAADSPPGMPTPDELAALRPALLRFARLQVREPAVAEDLLQPVLLALGIATRFGALALGAVNGLAVYAYAHVLREPGFEAALGQHYLWGVLLLGVTAFGPGALSVDALQRRRGDAPRPGGVASGREPAAL